MQIRHTVNADCAVLLGTRQSELLMRVRLNVVRFSNALMQRGAVEKLACVAQQMVAVRRMTLGGATRCPQRLQRVNVRDALASARMSHLLRLHQPVEFGSCHEAESNCFFLESRAVRMCSLGDFRGIVVANLRRERRDEHERATHQLIDSLFVGTNANNAMFGKRT